MCTGAAHCPHVRWCENTSTAFVLWAHTCGLVKPKTSLGPAPQTNKPLSSRTSDTASPSNQTESPDAAKAGRSQCLVFYARALCACIGTCEQGGRHTRATAAYKPVGRRNWRQVADVTRLRVAQRHSLAPTIGEVAIGARLPPPPQSGDDTGGLAFGEPFLGGNT